MLYEKEHIFLSERCFRGANEAIRELQREGIL